MDIKTDRSSKEIISRYTQDTFDEVSLKAMKDLGRILDTTTDMKKLINSKWADEAHSAIAAAHRFIVNWREEVNANKN